MKTNFYLPDKENILNYPSVIKSFENLSEDLCDQIATELLDKAEILSDILATVRKDNDGNVLPYRVADCDRDGSLIPENKAEAIAVELFNQYAVGREEHPLFGHVLDYQTPVGEDGSRKIAMICYLHAKDTMFIIEINTSDSDEPLISSVLESYVGLKLLDKDAFVANMENIYPEEHHITKRTKFKAAPIIFRNKDCKAYREYFESFNNVHVLMDELGIEPIFL